MARALTENQKKAIAFFVWQEISKDNTAYTQSVGAGIELLVHEISLEEHYTKICKDLQQVMLSNPHIKSLTTKNFLPDKEKSDKYFGGDFYVSFTDSGWRFSGEKAEFDSTAPDNWQVGLKSYVDKVHSKIKSRVVLPYTCPDKEEVTMKAQQLSIEFPDADKLEEQLYEAFKNPDFVVGKVNFKV